MAAFFLLEYFSCMLRKPTFLFLFLTLCGTAASAQIINIEEYRVRTDSVGWTGSGEASAYISKNDDFVFSLLTNIQIQHKRPKTTWWLITDLETVQANGQDAFVNAGFEHLRLNYRINERWVWEAFAQGVFNEPLGVDWKLLAGTGPRWKVVEKDQFRLYLAALYMFENEKNPESADPVQFHRMSSYASFTWELKNKTRFSNTTYYQPVLNDVADYRIASNTSLKAFMTKMLYLELEYNLYFDTRPPTGIVTTVYNLQSGIGLEF
ncbi:MAG TPA: hypothetical protein DCG24_07795 [Bacteroidetes bacterium]|nr:hypothetical protein [Bacteroidota bacterium]